MLCRRPVKTSLQAAVPSLQAWWILAWDILFSGFSLKGWAATWNRQSIIGLAIKLGAGFFSLCRIQTGGREIH